MKNNSLLAWGLIILVLAALAIVLIGGSWNGMMGTSGWGMMAGLGFNPYKLLVAIVVILFLPALVIWVVRSGYGMTNLVEPPCPHCGFRPIFASTFCPNCGKLLK